MKRVTKADALRHPNWAMGAKITIDSASLMNKGLELIEAVWLFGLRPEQVQIVVQRQSVIHSMVQFSDHSILAQLGVPDMRIPIQYALTWPQRGLPLRRSWILPNCASLRLTRRMKRRSAALRPAKRPLPKAALGRVRQTAQMKKPCGCFWKIKFRFENR